MSNRTRLRRVEPDAVTRARIKDDLRCWSCAAEARLSFTVKRGLSAQIDHLPDCPAVPAEHRAAGRTTRVTEPVLWQATR